MTAFIHQYEISEEEKQLQFQRISRLLKIYQRGYITNEEVEQVCTEWTMVADRLRKGGQMIAEMEAKQTNTTHPHFVAVSHLYECLVKICGIYDNFLAQMLMLSPEEYDQRFRQVYQTLHAS